MGERLKKWRTRLAEPCWMQLNWLMNYELSKKMRKVLKGTARIWKTVPMNCKSIWMKPKLMPSSGVEKWLLNWNPEPRILKPNWMVNNVDWVMLPKILGNAREASKN